MTRRAAIATAVALAGSLAWLAYLLPPGGSFEVAGDQRLVLLLFVAASGIAMWGVARARAAVRARRRMAAELEASERIHAELGAILDGVADGLTVQDATGRILYANRAAAEVLGYGSAEELLAAPLPRLVEDYEILDEDGNLFPLEDLPGRRVLEGEQTEGVTLRYRDRRSGVERWSFVRAAPLATGGSSPVVVNIFQDVTHERWTREAASFLATISEELLATALDYEGTLRRLAELLVPRLADLAAVYMVEEGGVRRVQVTHSDPAMQQLVRRLGSQLGSAPLPASPIHQVIETGEPELVPEITGKELSDAAVDTAHLAELQRLDLRSAMVVPLTAGPRRIGAISLITAGSRRPYGQEDLELAMDLAGRAAVAVENARLHERETAARLAAEENATRMARLQRVAAALAKAGTISAVTESVLPIVIDVTGAASASLGVFDEAGRRLSLVGAVGLDDETLAQWSALPVDAPLPVTEAVRSRRPVIIPDPDTLAAEYPHLVGPEGGPAGKAWAALPLTRDDDVVGAMALTFGEPREFDDEDRRFLAIVAQQCGEALERARLFEAERAAREEAVRRQERLNFLAEATEILSGSLEWEETLRRLVKLCVPRLADWCIVDVAERDGTLRQLAVGHVDPAKEELIRELRLRFPPDPKDHVIPRVIASGNPEIATEIAEGEVARDAQGPEHLRLLRELGVSSHMVVPLPARGRILGAISFIGTGARRYASADLALAEDLGRRAGLALDNARLYRERTELARTLERSFLPGRLPEVPGVEVAARYEPAGEGSEVGGDFYDLFEIGDGTWAVVIGDVSGKGPKAAAMTALARHTVRTAWLEQARTPTEILTILNQAVLRENVEEYCTVALGRLEATDGVRVTLGTAGHVPPLVLRADGSVERVSPPGKMLGVVDDLDVEEVTVELGPGESLLLYTDGVVDPGRTAPVPPEDRLAEFVGLAGGLDADLMASRILRHAAGFHAGPREDDAALLIIRARPRA